MDLGAAVLYTNNVTKIREFYEKTVGLTFEYQDGDAYVSFIFPNGGRLGINKSVRLPREKPGSQTFHLRVKDIQAQYEKYQKLGFVFYEPFKEHAWGTSFAILDPDGNKIGFIQPPDVPRSAK